MQCAGFLDERRNQQIFLRKTTKNVGFSAKTATSNSVAAGFFDEHFRRTMQPAGFFQRSASFFVWFRRKTTA
ncbi:hypothetical protein HanHA300_Chr02g0049041 [Helianthus annuus]|nr:hypothetical protein HanHA300_Chr02g0049041 [Helianthus annuus]KAJ0776850.1 hypothetical protein HanLR1_Chr02g0050421 [Helianthus annuus]